MVDKVVMAGTHFLQKALEDLKPRMGEIMRDAITKAIEHGDILERKLGLHQVLEVVYVVDGYEATLYADDDGTVAIAVGEGQTVLEAISALCDKLVKL